MTEESASHSRSNQEEQTYLERLAGAADHEATFMALWALFEHYCRVGETTKARQVLERMEGTPIVVTPGDDPWVPIAELVMHSLGDLALADKYLHQVYAREGRGPLTAPRRALMFQARAIELQILARREPLSPRIKTLLRELHKLGERIGVFEDSLVDSLRVLVPLHVGGRLAAELLRYAWADRAYASRFQGADPSVLGDIEGLLKQLPDPDD